MEIYGKVEKWKWNRFYISYDMYNKLRNNGPEGKKLVQMPEKVI